MGLGKKNRGKQRKAAKQQTAASATVSTPPADQFRTIFVVPNRIRQHASKLGRRQESN